MTESEGDFLEGLSEEDKEILRQHLGGSSVSTASPSEAHNVHKFLHEVAESDDTTKTGFLRDEEVGLPELPQRTFKELALFCKEIGNMDYFADYFLKRSEILTSTSLSRNAKLLELAVTARRQVEDVTKKGPIKENKGWFKRRKKGGDEE